MSLPSDGGEPRQIRRALTTAGFVWTPENTAAKYGYGDWRDRVPFDPEVDYQSKFGSMRNTAITGEGLYILDFDLDAAKDVLAALGEVSHHLAAPATLRYRDNSNRVATLFRQDGSDSLYRCVSGTDGAVEIFAGPRSKLTSFGTNKDKHTGVVSTIRWGDQVPGDLRRSDLPLVTGAAVDRFCQAVQPLLGDAASIKRGTLRDQATAGLARAADDVDELYRALEYVPNLGVMHWTEWNRIGMAVFAASSGDDLGLAAFALWTRQNPLTAHRDCLKRWRDYATSPPTHIGAGTIFKLAIDNGFRRKRPNQDDPMAVWAAKEAQRQRQLRNALERGAQQKDHA